MVNTNLIKRTLRPSILHVLDVYIRKRQRLRSYLQPAAKRD